MTVPPTIAETLRKHRPDVIIHAAAYADVAGAERDREHCWHTNVVGTRNLVRNAALAGMFVVYISTDYVFSGERGDYREDDTPGPVRNYYALSKLVAEESVRTLPRHLIIRTSFRAAPWPYAVAYSDLYTSQEYLDVVAPEIALAIAHLADVPYETLHIAGPRTSAYELARKTRPDVRAASRAESTVELPADVSLNTSLWRALRRTWRDQ